MDKQMKGGHIKVLTTLILGEYKQYFDMVWPFIDSLLKAYAFQYLYNKMWPKLVINSGLDPSKFEPLTFYESLLVVNLFRLLN